MKGHEAGNSQRNEQVIPDPYAAWTDDQRIAEAAHTGDGRYLTPELARKMQVAPEMMQQVPGATEEDWKSAEMWDGGYDAELSEMEEELYERLGIDEQSLSELRNRDDEYVSYLDRLFEVASMPVEMTDEDIQDDDRAVIEYAKRLLKEHAISIEQGPFDLVGMIRTREVAGVRDVQIIEEVFDAIHSEFVALSHTFDLPPEQRDRGERLAKTLSQFSHISENTFSVGSVDKDSNYLADRYFYNFCLKQKFTEPTTLDEEELELADNTVGLERLADFDRDALVPFEIEKGRLALFGVDGAVLYVADREYSEEKRNLLADLKDQITYSVKGQYFARRIVADVPYRLEVEADSFIDASGQLGRDEYRELFIDKELLRDFLYLQRADMRETIERDFRVTLSNLSIKEQVFFLKYLQETSVAYVQKVQDFTAQYGLDGLRTFLSLEREEKEFGDKLVAFGMENRQASDIFDRYSDLVVATYDTQALLREHVAVETEKLEQTEELIRDTIMARAHDLLKSAILSDQPEALGQKLQQVSTEGIIFASIFRSLFAEGNFSLEQMKETTFGVESGAELTPEDVAEMERLYRQSYAQAEFQGPFVDGLVERMHETIRNTSARWSILRHKGTPIGFCRFMDQGEAGAVTRKHFGAFNVNPAYGNGKLGEAMFLSVLANEGNDGVPIVAECLPHAPISAKYIESGFDAVGSDTYEGHTILKIERTTASSDDPRKQIPSADILAGGIPPEATLRRITDADTFPELQSGQKIIRLIPSAAGLYALFVPKG